MAYWFQFFILNVCVLSEFMSRGSVYDFLHKHRGVFKLPSLLKVAIDVSKGMNYLHQNNIIHRDLKTANLLMDENEVRVFYKSAHGWFCLSINIFYSFVFIESTFEAYLIWLWYSIIAPPSLLLSFVIFCHSSKCHLYSWVFFQIVEW